MQQRQDNPRGHLSRRRSKNLPDPPKEDRGLFPRFRQYRGPGESAAACGSPLRCVLSRPSSRRSIPVSLSTKAEGQPLGMHACITTPRSVGTQGAPQQAVIGSNWCPRPSSGALQGQERPGKTESASGALQGQGWPRVLKTTSGALPGRDRPR